jgi:hypothetical protein
MWTGPVEVEPCHARVVQRAAPDGWLSLGGRAVSCLEWNDSQSRAKDGLDCSHAAAWTRMRTSWCALALALALMSERVLAGATVTTTQAA